MSRQTEWQNKKIALGLCCICGTRPIHPDSKRQCYPCRVKGRVAQRNKLGYSRKRPGRAGRPLITRLPMPASDLKAA